MENAVRMPRDKPKPSKEEPKKPRRTEMQRRERMAKARHDYDARKRAERRANVVRFVETYHIGEGDADSHDVPYVQDWMFPITVEGNTVTKGGIRRERFTIRSKREFLEMFKPWVVPGVHAERKESLADDTRRARGPRHKRVDYYDEDFSVYAQLSGTHGEWTNEDDVVYNELLEEILRGTEATRTEALLAAEYLIDLTPGPMLLQFMNSPTGLVEAILFYAEVTPNLLVLQVVSSQLRNGTVRDQVLNGSRGSWTGTDDVATTSTQLSLLTGFGTVDVNSRFAFRGCPAYPFLLSTGFTNGFVYTFEPYATTVGGTETTRYAHYDEFWDVESAATDTSAYAVASSAATENAILDVCCPVYGLGLYADFRTPTSAPIRQWYALADAHAFNYLVREVSSLPPPAGVAGVAFLNGANGEATNKDDVRKGARGRQRKAAPRRQRRAAPRRKTGKRGRQRGARAALGLSPCALKYARAIADPFHPDAVGACVPVFPSPDSQKVHSVQRSVTMVVGAGGVGGCFFSPSTASDSYNVAVTTAQYSATYLQMPTTEVVGDFGLASASSLPWASGYLQAAAETGVQARLVSFGVKVTYTGTQVDMGGTIAGFFEPNHYPVAQEGDATPSAIAWNMSEITARPYAAYESVDRRMNFCLSTAAVSPSETDFDQEVYPFCQRYVTSQSAYAGIQGNAIGLVMVVGKPGVTFNVEIVTHVEYTGAPANASLSRTHTDARGFEMVQQASGQLASATANNRRSGWAAMTGLLAEAARELAPVAISAIGAYNPAAGTLARIAGRAAGFH
jgi:hypothetical protein